MPGTAEDDSSIMKTVEDHETDMDREEENILDE